MAVGGAATARAVSAEGWISRADAAELARCSEATIKRLETKHDLETRSGPNGQTRLRLADLVRLGRIRPEYLPAGASPAGTAELRRTQEQLVAVQRELGEVRGRLAERDAVVATLTGQVTEKDRQIRRLTDVIDSLGRPAQQSGGQQQWVAVGRVLIARPELVFADEPTGTLGSRADAALLAFLRDATRFLGQTIVMVTHDPVAAAHADRVVLFANGRIVNDLPEATADTVLARMAGPSGTPPRRGLRQRLDIPAVQMAAAGRVPSPDGSVPTRTRVLRAGPVWPVEAGADVEVGSVLRGGERMSEVLWGRRPVPVPGPDAVSVGHWEPGTPMDLTIIRRRVAAALRGSDRRWAAAPVSEGAGERLLLCVEELASNALRHGRAPV